MNTNSTRRSFVQAVFAFFVGVGRALGGSLHRLVPNRQEEDAAEKGRQRGVGTVILEGPEQVEAYSFQTWTLVYSAGKGGIKPGGGLRIGLRHLLDRQGTMPQTRRPSEDGYLTARAKDVSISVSVSKKLSAQYFAWQNLVQVMVGEPGLKLGEQLRITFGDRRDGSRGWRVQPFDETDFGFKCYADISGDGAYIPVEASPTIEILAAEPTKIIVLVPSSAEVGQPSWCLVRAGDQFGNPAPRYRGNVRLSATDPRAELPETFTFTADDRGVHRFENVVFRTPGDHTILGTDGDLAGRSNPIRIAREPCKERVFWGDLHTHTLQSDGRGTVEQAYDFAKRVAGLDFAAVSDHAFEILDEMWERNKRVTKQLNEPGRFVTMNAFEWSGTSTIGGDHNVYFLGDDPPIYRSSLMYHPKNYQMDHDAPKVDHVTKLFQLLRENFEPGTVLCIPHWGGRRGNPRWHDPQVQRLIEIFSEHRRSEEWARTFLDQGHRVGIMASGDNHSGNPGYGCLWPSHRWDTQEIGMALLAVQSEQLSRESVFHALYNRRVYATSGARILLDFRAAGQPMGSEILSKIAPEIEIDVVGTAPIERIEIKRDGQTAAVRKAEGESAKLTWRDPDFDVDKPCFYYVRMVQADGEEAISSPVWVN